MNFDNPAFIAQLRHQMLSFASQKLADPHKAEDLVQEALTKAYQYKQAFIGKSSMKTWVFAILKNKIIDDFRKEKHHHQLSDIDISNTAEDDEYDDSFVDLLFQQNGHWQSDFAPADWQTPEQWVEQDDFWKVFDSCVNALPAKHAQIFILREVIELSTDEICQEMQLSISNVNTIMYRCRTKLRSCLEAKWL